MSVYVDIDDALATIARKHLRLSTLQARNSDSLDFHEHAVWSIEAALRDAFALGQQHARTEPRK